MYIHFLNAVAHCKNEEKPCRSLTGDASAPNDITEAEIDSRVQEVIDMEPDDP